MPFKLFTRIRTTLSASIRLWIVASLALALFSSAAAPMPEPASWQSKVDPWVLQTTQQTGQSEFLVMLSAQADLSAAERLATRQEKGRYVYQTLTRLAARTQPALIEAVESLGAEYRPYWIANMLWVRGDAAALAALAARTDVAHIYANPSVHTDLPTPEAAPTGPDSPSVVEWGVSKINANSLWAQGYRGQGIVIGGQDTGYQWDHPALKLQYRGWDSGANAANHDYNWHDAIHENNPNTGQGNPCGFNAAAPCDDQGHGTHTMGTMVGDDGGSNQIGVAPAARWISCRNMEQGWGTPATYIECYQWFTAPTTVSGQNANPDKAPDVINNSWGCPASEGCTSPTLMQTVVENVQAAGILTVHSAGNSGSACSTVSEPASIYAASFTVGATDSGDNIAGFSSRGPVTRDGSNRLKPNVTAPGVSVRSSTPGGSYGYMSGTSMASPHVAGLVALLLSTNPALSGQPETVRMLIERSALPKTSAQTCGDFPGSAIPNAVFGWGRVDALRATAYHAVELDVQAPPAGMPGDSAQYTFTIQHTAFLTLTTPSLSLSLPESLYVVSASLPYTQSAGQATWALPAIPANASLELNIMLGSSPAAGGPQPFTVTLSAPALSAPLSSSHQADLWYRQLLPWVLRIAP